jgi:hypothetical protein
LDELLPYEISAVLKQKEHILQRERIELLKEIQVLSEALLSVRNGGRYNATQQTASGYRLPQRVQRNAARHIQGYWF